MEQKYNIQYTKSGLSELSRFKEEQVNILERLIVDEKKYPGVDFIEITASDIQEYAKRFEVKYTKNNKRILLRLLLATYFLLGILVSFFGLFYQFIEKLLINRPQQISYIVGGLVLTFSSLVALIYLKSKESNNLAIHFRNQNRYLEELEIQEQQKYENINSILEKIKKYEENFKK